MAITIPAGTSVLTKLAPPSPSRSLAYTSPAPAKYLSAEERVRQATGKSWDELINKTTTEIKTGGAAAKAVKKEIKKKSTVAKVVDSAKAIVSGAAAGIAASTLTKESTTPIKTVTAAAPALSPETVGKAAATNISAGSESGGQNMGAYKWVDDALAGLLPGGVEPQWTEAGLKALGAAGAYYLAGTAASALTGGKIGGSISRLFGGGSSARKVKRGRIGVRRSDYKRVRRMMGDLHRLDKFVNKYGLADIKFKKVARG